MVAGNGRLEMKLSSKMLKIFSWRQLISYPDFTLSQSPLSLPIGDMGSVLQLGVTVIWVSLSFGYPRTQIPSVLGITGDTQNTESLKLGQVKSSTSLLKTQLFSY